MVLAQAVVSLVAARQGRRADAVKAWECAYDGWPRLVEAVPIRGRIPQIALAEAASLLGHEQRALAVLRSLPHDQFPDEIGKFWWAEYGRLLELAGSSVSISESLPGMTPARLRVLRALHSHKTVPVIAEELGRSVATVRVHVREVYAALGVHTRAQAVARGIELGLITVDTAG